MPLIASLISNKYLLSALGAVLVVLSLWGFGKYQHAQGYAKAQHDRAFDDLKSFKTESERLQGLSVTLEAQLTEMRQAKPQIIERYNRVVIEKPLPADCVVDPDRLRELNAATQAANTRESRKSVPANK